VPGKFGTIARSAGRPKIICVSKCLHIYLGKYCIMRRDVFQAIADPTRREIIHLVASHSLNLNSIAENFDMSRPAISQHIKILSECGLILIKKQGRERYCEARLKPLSEVSEWVEQYRKRWTEKFDALDDVLDDLKSHKRKARKRK
jgi:DNA-binding transcriptional ArsR family regulator